MKIILFATLLSVATIFSACKKDKNTTPPIEQNELPKGQYRLTEMHQADSTGIDSAGVKFPKSTMILSFDNAAKTANLTGKAESMTINGGYKVGGSNALTDPVFTSDRTVATENDLAVLDMLENGESFKNEGDDVVIETEDKGYLTFSMQK